MDMICDCASPSITCKTNSLEIMFTVFITSTSDTNRATFKSEYKHQNNSIGLYSIAFSNQFEGQFLYFLSNIEK